MDTILSSFCFTQSTAGGCGFYHRLPPVCFETWDRFVPDYSALFLFERFFLDAQALDRIRRDPHFRAHDQMIEALEASGRLEVRDFSSEIAPFDHLIDKALDRNLRNLGQWHEPFKAVVDLWEPFLIQLQMHYHGQWEHAELSGRRWGGDDAHWPPERLAMSDISRPMHYGLNRQLNYTLKLIRSHQACEDHYRAQARGVVSDYLRHVLTTMCLADHLGASIHDWEDIRPVYQHILAEHVRVAPLRKLQEARQMRELVKVMFPHFKPKSAEALARALDDKRIEALRDLVSRSIETDQQFDVEFANAALREVLATEQQIGKFREVVGWASKPLSFIPWIGNVADTAASMAAEAVYAKRKRREKSWFYLLSEIDCGGLRDPLDD